MDGLRKKRGIVKGSMTRLEKLVTEPSEEEVSVIDAQIRLDKLNEIMETFEQVQMEIEMLLSEDEIANESKGREEIEGKYYIIKAWCLKKLAGGQHVAESTRHPAMPAEHRVTGECDETVRQLADTQAAIATVLSNLSTRNPVRDTVSHDNPKLPSISLPSFDGNYREWPTFKDLYKTIVHNSSSLFGAQKLQYLKLSLKGDAASVLKHINISDANYDQAWLDLCTMFDKEKVIVESHIKTIMEQPEIKSQPTAASVRQLYNTSHESVTALRSIGVAVDHWDAWLIYVISTKLDPESRKLWARTSAAKEKPTFKEMLECISTRQFELESTPLSKVVQGNSSNRRSVCTAISGSCIMCKGSQFLAACPQFSSLNLFERRSFIAQKGLCYNCLHTGHAVKACKSGNCRKCKARHHTLIHTDKGSGLGSDGVSPRPSVADGVQRGQGLRDDRSLASLVAGHKRASKDNQSHKLLPTAVVLVQNRFGEFKPCRALLDSGSQVTLITEACAQFLGLPRSRCNLTIDAVGDAESMARGLVSLNIRSQKSEFGIASQAIVLKNITKQLPPHIVCYNGPTQLAREDLADPFFGRPGAIDILLKASVMFRAIRNGKIDDAHNKVIAQNTEFGWVLTSEDEELTEHRRSAFQSIIGLEDMIERFWQLEEPQRTTRYLHDDHPCEVHFKAHVQRDELGRFVVRLPFKGIPDLVGNSRLMAEQRLQAMERRFLRDAELQRQYTEFMREYLSLGHMIEITPGCSVAENGGYYLPHHAVIKPDSSTTRLRVVFDASRTPLGGRSLNSQLLTGPVLQNDLTTILLQFMLHPIALSADIAKMYRQIFVHPLDRKFQRILWRESSSEPLRTFELTTITYGTGPASFLATRCLIKLAEDHRDEFPRASKMIRNHFYMDDFLASCNSRESAKGLVDELCLLMQKAGFNLRKWTSNSKELLDEIPLEKREPNWSWSIDSNQPVKTLGLRWHPVTDTFSFEVKVEQISSYSKQNLLSEVARIFDPLGFLAPFLINYRILLQRLWQEKVSWTAPISLHHIARWEALRNGIRQLRTLARPRYTSHNEDNLQMHGFCDASEEAYAAVVYLRSVSKAGEVSTSLIAAKVKVAPLKPHLVIARLELCAAALLANLVAKLREVEEYRNILFYGWTDSSIVLHWLNGHPRKFACFVANRISSITNIVPAKQWRHIRGEINPADCASRGVSVEQLISNDLWWKGPPVIRVEPVVVEDLPSFGGEKRQLEERQVVLVALSDEARQPSLTQLLERFDSLTKLLRVTAWILRF